jgi:Tol biopolymer transport system component
LESRYYDGHDEKMANDLRNPAHQVLLCLASILVTIQRMCVKGTIGSAWALSSFLVVAVGVGLCAEHPSETTVATPKVISVTQLTHDGVSKTNLLSDDSNLYVTELPSTDRVLAKFSLPSGSRSFISSGFTNVQALDVSPDRASLLVAPMQGGGENEFWTLPVKAGSALKLGELTGRDASWSTDGQQLIFSKGSGLYVAKANGTEERKIYSANGSVFGPRLSPDGKHIRFTVGDTSQGTTVIWEIGRDGTNPHAVLDGWEYASGACCGKWTADGRYYIFQVTQNSPTTITALWALPDTGTAPVKLTNGPMSFGNASPASDNKRIWAIGVQPAGQAVKYNARTKELVAFLPGVSATDMDFSSDGKWVTYVAVPEGTLWRCRADGSERLQLTSSPERTALPRWSPDGKQIAYVSMQPGKPWKIVIISRQGGNPETVLEEDRSQIDANWSPDGTQIMFGYLHAESGINIRVLNVKSHKVTNVPGSEGLFSPRWSPDGRYIAALSPDFTKVMLFDYRTQKWSIWLTESAGAVSYPVWSAESKYLYFDDLVTDEESIRRVKVGESRTERVFKLEGIERYPGPFGLWSGRAADGSWMFVRDRSTQEVYQLSVVLP